MRKPRFPQKAPLDKNSMKFLEYAQNELYNRGSKTSIFSFVNELLASEESKKALDIFVSRETPQSYKRSVAAQEIPEICEKIDKLSQKHVFGLKPYSPKNENIST